jgi:hypothetical protein
VIRSVAGVRPLVAQGSREPESVAITARIAVSASADSDKPRAAARAANRSFSSGEVRTVIEGADDSAERQVMVVRQSGAVLRSRYRRFTPVLRVDPTHPL